MDKKILLGGAAALLLVGNMYATPANAAIDLSIGGEAKLTGNMSECGPTNLGQADVDGEAIITAAGSTVAGVDAFHASQTTAPANATWNALVATFFTSNAQPCAGNKRAGVDWGMEKKLVIDASGTLANGLEVSFSDDLKLHAISDEVESFNLTLGGAFGSLQFKAGAPSAVDAAMVTGKKKS